MKSIAVLTSGGDAPGMNAAIRAVVRSGLEIGWRVFGVRSGYSGLIEGGFAELGARDVGGIIQKAGTMLGSSRCAEFTTEDGRRKALRELSRNGVDGLVVIGGSGSQTGAYELSRMGFPVVGIASTIDNDLQGTDITIGVDTALNVALEAIDRLKVTASSLRRAFFVEVMGRDCGYLALIAGIAGGAETVVIPERDTDPEAVVEQVRAAYQRGKLHALVVVAEGARYDAAALMQHFQRHTELGFELRATILGHVQRGGTPTAFDRLLASRLGFAATQCLSRKDHGNLVGWTGAQVSVTPLASVAGKTKQLDPNLLELARILAR